MQEGFLITAKESVMSSESPATELYSLYCELLQAPRDINIYKAIARAVTLFGREIVFKAISSLESMEKIDHKNMYPLLRFMCNKIADAKDTSTVPSLVAYKDTMEKLAEKAKTTKWKIRSPFDE